MRFPQNTDAYLRMYEALPALLSGPYDPDSGDEARAALINRDAMAGEAALQGRLEELDTRVAEALAATGDDWRTRLLQWADACRFGSAPWWTRLRHASAGAKAKEPAAR